MPHSPIRKKKSMKPKLDPKLSFSVLIEIMSISQARKLRPKGGQWIFPDLMMSLWLLFAVSHSVPCSGQDPTKPLGG